MDDDKQHNIHMKKRLDTIFYKHNLEACTGLVATDPSEVLAHSLDNLEKNNVYFLDVDLSCDLDGIGLAMKIREHDARSYIIFVSAHPEFVIPSLKTKIFDFLVKPISVEMLENCVLSIYRDHMTLKNEKKQMLLLKSGLKVYQINAEDIVFLEKFGHLLVVHTLKGQITSHEPLDNIAEKLDSDEFCRCHKSYIANIRHIAEINYKSNLIGFKNGESCILSKRCKKELKAKCPAL